MARMVGRLAAGSLLVRLSIAVALLGGSLILMLLVVRDAVMAPAGDAGTTPGGAAPITRWLDAAIIGDYATARRLTNDPDFMFGIWQDRTEKALQAGHLQSYTIASTEQRGATTAYQVQFVGGDTPHCMLLLVDEQGMVSASYPYVLGACAPVPTTDATRSR